VNSKPDGTIEKVTDAFLPGRLVKFQDNAWGEGWWHVYVTLPNGRELLIADIEGQQRGKWVAHPKAYRHPTYNRYSHAAGDIRMVAAENVIFDFVEWQNVREEDTKVVKSIREHQRMRNAQLDDMRAARVAKGLEG
jgi:hypothetical protein